jgi:4,5-DOPA dioxygenase extradiol
MPAMVLYVPHGGGPLPLLGDSGHDNMRRVLEGIIPRLGSPETILVISAHREAARNHL